MKSLFILYMLTSLFTFNNNSVVEAPANAVVETIDECEEVIYTLHAPEDYMTPELEEELKSLTADEDITAFFKKHNTIASEFVEAAPNEEVLFNSGCGSWTFVTVAGACFSPFRIKLVEKRECWAGTTSNGTRYGLYTEWRYSC